MEIFVIRKLECIILSAEEETSRQRTLSGIKDEYFITTTMSIYQEDTTNQMLTYVATVHKEMKSKTDRSKGRHCIIHNHHSNTSLNNAHNSKAEKIKMTPSSSQN